MAGHGLNKRMRAVFTAETAVVMSVVLLSLMLIIFTGFYLHDLNILSGAAYESAQAGAEWKRMDENRSVEGYFQQRISGKLLYFSGASCSVEESDTRVLVRATAASGRMRMGTAAAAAVSEPEDKIRKLDMLKKTGGI